MGSPESPRGEAGAVASRISQEMAAIHEESYGRAPKQVGTYLLDDAVLCICELDLLRYEQLIVDNGGGSSVLEVRKAFQEAIEATFKASIEHMTGRSVIGFLSDTHLDPSFAIEFFKLGPETRSTLQEPEER